MHHVTRLLEEHSYVRCLMINFSKAFDVVRHDVLGAKLAQLVQQEGLKMQYEDKENPAVRKWVKRLMSLCMLPTFAIGYAWEWLQQPPSTGSAATDAKLCVLASYFGCTWIIGKFPASL